MHMDKDRYGQGYFSCCAALVLLAAAHVHFNGPRDIHATASASHGTGRMPTGPADHGHEFCPLCWAQTAASSLLVPPAVQARIPSEIAAPRPTPVFHSLTERTAPNAFRPRAPPHARLRLTA